MDISIYVKNKKNKVLFVILNILVFLALICSMLVAYVAYNFYYHPEHVEKRDGKKYVAYVVSNCETTVYYYEYKGPLFTSTHEAILERYGPGVFDPIKNNNKHKYVLQSTEYYDKNRKRITYNPF